MCCIVCWLSYSPLMVILSIFVFSLLIGQPSKLTDYGHCRGGSRILEVGLAQGTNLWDGDVLPAYKIGTRGIYYFAIITSLINTTRFLCQFQLIQGAKLFLTGLQSYKCLGLCMEKCARPIMLTV